MPGGECPVCSRRFDSAEALSEHVNSHFDDSQPGPGQPADANAAATACPLCGERVAPCDAASHQLAHQLQQEELEQQQGGDGAAARAAAEQLDARMAAELAAQEWGDDADGGGGGGDGSSDGEAALEEAHHQQQLEELYFEQLRARYGYSTQARPGCCRLCGQEGHWVRDCPRNPDKQEAARRVVNPQPQLIAAAQQRAAFTPLPAPSNGGSASGSLVQLLAACLERQHLPASVCYQAGLCGAVQHFGATLFSSGWGCGYNNMQALASHLLAARPETRGMLFGGAGYVPDIPALQAWLEAAWQAGFDRQGAEQLEGRVQGTQKWVGTTECAALLRSFGLRAQIVDFGVRPGQAAGAAPGAATAAAAAAGAGGSGGGGGGPVPVHPGMECDGCGQFPIRGDRYRSDTLPDYDLCAACHASAPAASGPFRRMMPGALSMSGPRGKEGGAAAAGGGAASGGPSAGSIAMRELLLLWVWRYFMAADDEENTQPSSGGGGGGGGGGAANPQAPAAAALAAAAPDAKRQRLAPSSSRVRLSGKPPLYFQHEGHSRTIIGTERRLVGRERRPEHTLLILDPGTPGDKLAAALSQRQGWQRLLKRGAHTLRHSQYQLLFVQPGIAAGAELEALKTVAACERH